MLEDKKIIELFFERDEKGIQELDNKYGKIFHKLSYNILQSKEDVEECMNDSYLGAWNRIPPEKPLPLVTYICKIVRNISLKKYYSCTAKKECLDKMGQYSCVCMCSTFNRNLKYK